MLRLNAEETQILGELMGSIRNACKFELSGNGIGQKPDPQRAAYLLKCSAVAEKMLHSIQQAQPITNPALPIIKAQ